jgi:hypothetical protein
MKLIIVREPGGLAVVIEGRGGRWTPLAESHRVPGSESAPATRQHFKDLVKAAAEALDLKVEDRS